MGQLLLPRSGGAVSSSSRRTSGKKRKWIVGAVACAATFGGLRLMHRTEPTKATPPVVEVRVEQPEVVRSETPAGNGSQAYLQNHGQPSGGDIANANGDAWNPRQFSSTSAHAVRRPTTKSSAAAPVSTASRKSAALSRQNIVGDKDNAIYRNK